MPKYYSPDGNIEVWEQKPEGYYTVEEWQELHPAPAPPEPSIDEQLAELDARYNTKKTEYTTAYTAAVMRGDTETAEAIKDYLDTLDDDYDAEYDRIVGEEEE
ncbi:hypothetical protein SAMN02745671_01158 [Anaerovibrio lipolyticus DSM 3074]|uniref:Uncharacterized protein n=1 Tax=Anaerovibrio lipolyticus DSM 3074 TaxID=1120997 RepID=A0A1M6CKL0_9FIRM|nr:hypothetical protein [Anaerovibrio lipolyticus]SHI61550.1 hypothetical protein SAMN02745671_01158 [Anaerovibrio lipolyticus DSM 3074]